MFSTQSITQTLKGSKWPAEQQQELLKITPNFGPSMLEFIENEVFSFGSELSSKHLVNALKKISELLSRLQGGDIVSFIEFVKTANGNAEFDFGRYALPAALDVKRLMRYKKIPFSSELMNAIYDIECKLFRELSSQEVVDILKENIFIFILKLNFLMELKRFSVKKVQQNKRDWIKPFIYNLQSNEALLTKNPIMLEGKQVPASVKNWINDFIAFIPKPISQRTTLEVVQYLRSSPNTRNLTKAELDMLLEIFKVYLWLLNPVVTNEELDEYEQLLNPNIKITGKQEMTIEKPIAVYGKAIKSGSVEIDRRLEDLKRRVDK